MNAASSIASLLAPAATSAAGRSGASPADAAPDTSFEAILREAQADQTAGADETEATRNIVASPGEVTLPATETGTSPITPAQVPPPEPLLPTLPVGQSTEQPSSAGTRLDQSQASEMISGFLSVPTPAATSSAPETPTLDGTSTAQGAPMPATTASAVQAQALASQVSDTAIMTQATPQSAAPTTGEALSTQAQAAPATASATTSMDAAQLAQLGALVSAAAKPTASDMPKAPRQAASTVAGMEGLTTDNAKQGQAAATQPQLQPVAQGQGGSATSDPLQQVSAASADTKRGADAPAPQAATAAPATNFAVELRQAATSAPGATPTMHVPLEALAVNIARKVEQGLNQFEISLTPVELGKLDISLKIGDDGRVHAVLRAERQDTLDLLRQDARTLENQLRQAGLDVGSNALSFQLSQGQGNKYKSALTADRVGQASITGERSTDAVATTFIASRRPDGVDIHV